MNSVFFVSWEFEATLLLKMGLPKRKLVFQPSIFRCHVSFREGIFQGLLRDHDGFRIPY